MPVRIREASQRSPEEVVSRRSAYVVAFVVALAVGVGMPLGRTEVAVVQHGLDVVAEVFVVVVAGCQTAILAAVLGLDQDLVVVAVLVVDLAEPVALGEVLVGCSKCNFCCSLQRKGHPTRHDR